MSSERYFLSEKAELEFQNQLIYEIEKKAPLEAKISSLPVPNITGTPYNQIRSLLKHHSFPTFNTAFNQMMSRTHIEDPDSILSKA